MTDGFDARREQALAARERTRRHFFTDCGVGLGTMALASLLEPERPAGAQPVPWQPGLATSRHGPRA